MKSGAVAGIAAALADPTRVAIVEAIARGEKCVCDLTEELGAAQSRLSFHLKILKDAGLVSVQPEGRMMYYSLRPGAARALASFLRRWERS